MQSVEAASSIRTKKGVWHQKNGDVIYSSRAVAVIDHLKGRSSELSSLRKNLTVAGRQSFIYGLRGVGKTSLAQTIAAEFSGHSVYVMCDKHTTFGSLIQSIIRAGIGESLVSGGTLLKGSVSVTGSFLGMGGKADGGIDAKFTTVPEPRDVNEAASLFRSFFCKTSNGNDLLVVVDEFDQIEDVDLLYKYGMLMKFFADNGIAINFITCGVAENLTDIFKSHSSSIRYFEGIEVKRLGLQACLNIISDIEQLVGIEVEHNSKMHTVQISDGFPYFVHLLCEKLFWSWHDDPSAGKVTKPVDYEHALVSAAETAHAELKDSYEKATRGYKSDGEMLAWAVADGSLLEKTIGEVYKDFEGIFERLNSHYKPKEILNKAQVTSRLASMRQKDRGELIVSPKRGQYAFAEKRMRGYARIRAALQQLKLRPDHPLLPRP